ncbi:unnamed protein product [Chilo suppressalis]|uniref:4-nitrophenylphosphatase n=1 Tax=Chilo suppressalis TaxID=168631 RepID=A0ABN8B2L0_CHISP|nr:hypothetical protein evm_006436 [Chilo suppressalis]CAH0399695.1 unnamed protein product [Chilo suppressalis]
MAEPVNLTELSSSDFKKFLDSFDYVFSDCDGVIWSNGPLPGSGEFFKKIKQHGKAVHYVSNNSLRTKQDYEDKFKSSDIENGFENLTIPSVAIAEYLKSLNFNKKIYCVACHETVHVLERAGFQCFLGPDYGAEYYIEYLQYLVDDLDVGAVVFDSDFRVNLPRLYKALTYLKRPEVIFISGATDKHVPYKPGCLVLGTGIFTDIVVNETKRQPVQLGKPGKLFGEFAMKRAGVTDPSRVLFIGDMIEQDVGLGKATGFKTLLVLTNNTKEDMLAHPTLRPDYFAPSLGSLVPLL